MKKEKSKKMLINNRKHVTLDKIESRVMFSVSALNLKCRIELIFVFQNIKIKKSVKLIISCILNAMVAHDFLALVLNLLVLGSHWNFLLSRGIKIFRHRVYLRPNISQPFFLKDPQRGPVILEYDFQSTTI
ncbi:MAG: hypothetical protein PHY93_17525 [Bacteriovorax sp.]|nr:hypothetical protein [Bacteriovorax sp.]